MLVIAGPGAHGEGAELASGAQLEREQKRAQQRTKPVDCEARGEGIPHTCSAVRPEDESIVRVVWFVDGARAVWVSIDAAHSQDRFVFWASHGPLREGHSTQRTRIRKSAGWAEIVL